MSSDFPEFLPLEEPAALYLHVPFCRSRCGYCSFFTASEAGPEKMDRWLELVLEEWETWRPLVRKSGVSTVYFGGGTPAILPVALWKRLLDRLELSSLRPPGIPWDRFATVEANPGTLTREKLALWQDGGIGRISLGIQSFNPRVLQACGRHVTTGELEESRRLVQEYWTGQVNLDLILGLPGQSDESVAEDVTEALLWNPGHLAMYEYIKEPGTPLSEKISQGLAAPSPGKRQGWWFQLARRLVAAGYHNYEISNFARPGQESLHNLAYWTGRPYLGLGPGAHSFLPAQGRWIRKANPEVWDWPGGGEPWGFPEREVLEPQDLIKDLFISGLRTRSGLEKSRFSLMTGLPSSWLREGVRPQDRSWYHEGKNTWGMTDRGRDRMDWLLLRYDFDRL